MAAKDGAFKQHLGKLVIALTGLATIAGHWLVANMHQRENQESVKSAVAEKLRGLTAQNYEQRLAHEREFVRKEEVEKAFEKLAQRVDRGTDQVEDLSDRVAQLEGYLRGKDRDRAEATRTFWRKVKKSR